jgi:hypothetical protein
VQALYDHGVNPDDVLANIGAVMAALLSKTHWQRCRSGAFSEEALDDPINRGRDMDARTRASQCSYV